MDRTLVRDGVALAYDEAGPTTAPATGPPSGSDLVFVHGWTCNRSFFAPQVAELSARHRCVSVDLRGHGASLAPVDGPYTVTQLADDLAWVIGELALDRPVVIGHSMGGAIALQLAATHPSATRAVVMVDPSPLRPPDVGQLTAAIESDALRDTQRLLIDGMFLPRSDPALKQRVADVMIGTPEHVTRACWRSFMSWDGIAAAGACTVPALHIAAASPFNAPHEMAAALPGLVTGWTVGGGHFNQLEVPDQVSSMIAQFLYHHVG